MAAAEGLVAEFSSFANFEENKRKSNLLLSFPKTGNQMGSFGQIRENWFFRFCRPRDYDLREPIPHTWASSHDNLFQSTFSAWSSREAILGTTPDWPI